MKIRIITFFFFPFLFKCHTSVLYQNICGQELDRNWIPDLKWCPQVAPRCQSVWDSFGTQGTCDEV